LLDVPRCLAENCGLNADDAVAQWKKLQGEGNLDYGLFADGSFGRVGSDLSEAKVSVVTRALEVATLMLRIDEQIAFKEIAKFHKK
jgi:chaperonin GroEL (HSP60 family)